MPGVWPLNNLSTQDNYVTAVTAWFPVGRKTFSLQVYNAAVYYRLLKWTPPGSYYDDPTEHYLAPVLASFDDPTHEGFTQSELFGGIMLRSAVAGKPAQVTVN